MVGIDEKAKDEFAEVTQPQNFGRLLTRTVQYSFAQLAHFVSDNYTNQVHDGTLGKSDATSQHPLTIPTASSTNVSTSTAVVAAIAAPAVDVRFLLWEYAREVREHFLKLLLLHRLGRIQGRYLDAAVQILSSVLDTRETIRRNGMLLYEFQWPPHGICPPAVPPAALSVAVDVLTTGSYLRLPALLEAAAKQAAPANKTFGESLAFAGTTATVLLLYYYCTVTVLL
eukprot:Lankesteria_metandrocarpae@DN7472_c0_g1_i1.p1